MDGRGLNQKKREALRPPTSSADLTHQVVIKSETLYMRRSLAPSAQRARYLPTCSGDENEPQAGQQCASTPLFTSVQGVRQFGCFSGQFEAAASGDRCVGRANGKAEVLGAASVTAQKPAGTLVQQFKVGQAVRLSK